VIVVRPSSLSGARAVRRPSRPAEFGRSRQGEHKPGPRAQPEHRRFGEAEADEAANQGQAATGRPGTGAGGSLGAGGEGSRFLTAPILPGRPRIQARPLGDARSTARAIVLGGEGRSRQPWRRRGLSGRSRI
jgi:hypothetical protein